MAAFSLLRCFCPRVRSARPHSIKWDSASTTQMVPMCKISPTLILIPISAMLTVMIHLGSCLRNFMAWCHHNEYNGPLTFNWTISFIPSAVQSLDDYGPPLLAHAPNPGTSSYQKRLQTQTFITFFTLPAGLNETHNLTISLHTGECHVSGVLTSLRSKSQTDLYFMPLTPLAPSDIRASISHHQLINRNGFWTGIRTIRKYLCRMTNAHLAFFLMWITHKALQSLQVWAVCRVPFPALMHRLPRPLQHLPAPQQALAAARSLLRSLHFPLQQVLLRSQAPPALPHCRVPQQPSLRLQLPSAAALAPARS